MSTSPRAILWISLIASGLLAAACSGPEDATTANPDLIEGASPTATDPAASPTPALPAWVQARLESGDLDNNGVEDALQRYVAFTGGGGVSHRSACENAARLDSVWPDGAALEVVASSSDECQGWTLVSDGETTSWVLDKYLSNDAPVATSGGGGGGGGGNGWVQVLQYGQGEWKIPLSQLRIAPAADTWCEVDSWHDPEGGDYLVKTLDGLPFVNPDPVRCGFGAVNSALILWVPAP